jgi:hypothetical protein
VEALAKRSCCFELTHDRKYVVDGNGGPGHEVGRRGRQKHRDPREIIDRNPVRPVGSVSEIKSFRR